MKKVIEYDKETRDYAMYLNGELVGYARSYLAAEEELDRLAYQILKHQAALTPPADPTE